MVVGVEDIEMMNKNFACLDMIDNNMYLHLDLNMDTYMNMDLGSCVNSHCCF